jgi:hypothetical protein
MAQSSKKERLNQAYEYLYQRGFVHSVTELAAKMERSRPGVNKALNGVPDYLNDKFLQAFAKTFPGTISLDWLINGTGEMLQQGQEPEPTREPSQPVIDHSSLVNATIAAKDGEIAALKACIRNKDEIIQMKDETIALLEKQIRLLERDRMIDTFPPIPMGVSEPITKQKK